MQHNKTRGYKVGDRVEVIEDNFAGIIIDLRGDLLLIRTDDGFDLEFGAHEVVPLMNQKIVNIGAAVQKQKEFSKEEEVKKKQKSTPKRSKVIPPMEVDLHIEKLVKHHRRLANHEILELQLDRAKRSIDLAIQKRLPRLVLIHGVGQGVLKAELDFLIGRYEGIHSEAADYQKYGQGATLVSISQKASRY